jgi:deazaflavin-dependent oxidoreductase (nitroreductase family)
MSRLSPRTRRIAGRAMRMSAALDRPRLRWLLNALSPAPVVVLVHRGRRSGRIYRTPVEAITEYASRGEIVVAPMWGEHTDWYRNVLAGGLVEARRQGESQRMEWRILTEDERREATAAYRRDYPLYARAILWMLVRVHGLSGDPVEAVARALPMLALRRAALSPASPSGPAQPPA